MNKNYLKNPNDEIDLLDILKDIWDGKIKLILITIVSILIGIIFYSQKPIIFKSSIIIKPAKTINLLKYFDIKNHISTTVNQKYNNLILLDMFISEIKDFEELVSVINKDENIKSSISNLSKNKQQKMLYNYSKSFNIELSEKMETIPEFIVSFRWHDREELDYIFIQTLELTLINFKKSIFKELDDLYKIKKNSIINDDLKRIEYLLEQSTLARELNISENQIDSVNLTKSNNVMFNINSNDLAYYLRGYKVIDKEISLIKSRNYNDLIAMEKEIQELKKIDIKWVDFNFFLIQKSATSNKIYLIASVLLGLMVGISYILISNLFLSKKNSANK